MPRNSMLQKTAVNPRHLHTALHHANLLAERKRVEAEVLDAVLSLLDSPAAPEADARRPTAADAQHFRAAVLPFQPSDYDALVEERNMAGRCGYALCPRPAQKARSTARRQFVDTAHGVEIVERKTLEVWCSHDCAKRALYVKVQLNEDPAWMRQAGSADHLELMVDNAQELDTALPLHPKAPAEAAAVRGDPDDPDDMDAAWAAREEAVEELVRDHITERKPSDDDAPPQPPQQPQTTEHTMAIEGHVPRIDRTVKDDDDGDDDDDDDDPQDWDRHLPG